MSGSYFQILVSIKDIKPQPWRRLLIKSGSTFHELHHILQIAFGWDNNHLYEFHYEGYNIGVEIQEDFDIGKDIIPSREVSLQECIIGEGEKLEYVYDYEDYWQHSIKIEKTIITDRNKHTPRCMEGGYSRPPERCGGPPGYKYLQEVLADRNHPDYNDLRGWLGYDLNPEFFDKKLVNRAYRNLNSYIKFFDNE